jgi:hypothetical protein
MYQKLQKISKQRRLRQMEEDRLNGFDHEPDKHADDEYYEDLALEKWNCLLRSYVTLGLSIRVVVKNKFFDIILNTAIVLAGILVGLSFYPNCPMNQFCVDHR